jgi:large subunit ribosomal protein L29
MSRPDLINRLNELRLELAKERGQIAIGGTPSNPGRIKEIKRTIARILTELKLRGEK